MKTTQEKANRSPRDSKEIEAERAAGLGLHGLLHRSPRDSKEIEAG